MPNDRLVIRTPDVGKSQYHNDLKLKISVSDTKNGMISFLEKFGYLYYAKLNKESWRKEFLQVKSHFLSKMFDPSDENIHDIDFKLKFIHLARQTSQWKHPGILNESNGIWMGRTGGSRMIAAGVCWENPWRNSEYFLFSTSKKPIEYFQGQFAQITKVSNDSVLRSILKNSMSDHDPLEIHAGFKVEEHGIKLELNSLSNENDFYSNHLSGYSDQWIKWKTDFEQNPEVHVYTNWPGQIRDSSNKWKIQIKGTTPELAKPANLSNSIYHDTKRNLNDVRKLYIFKPDAVDLAELFFWTDLDHNAFHTENWEVVLQQSGKEFVCKQISLSKMN